MPLNGMYSLTIAGPAAANSSICRAYSITSAWLSQSRPAGAPLRAVAPTSVEE